MTMTIRSFLLILGISVGSLMAGRGLIHYFQLESYQFPGYFRTLRRNLLRAVLPGFLLNAALAAGAALMRLVANEWVATLALIALALGAGWVIRGRAKDAKAKKPLVVTARVKRLYGVGLVVFAGVQLLLIRGGAPYMETGDASFLSLFCVALQFLFSSFLPLWVALAGLCAWPVEKGISEMYFQDARRVLRQRDDLIRIGITGSWGKTSVKFILGTMLEEKYHTLITPASYNTPMGVTKVIRTGIEPGHRVFVAEMGARHVGDIREMCRLVRPTIGVLTSVGPQHLDTFKTLERVTRTKYELMDAIPDNGMCFFADDRDICRELFEKTPKDKYIAGMDPAYDDVWAENLRATREGSEFDLCFRDIRIPCRTALLGELNIRNILLCAAICRKLGLTGEQIRRGIRKLQPVEHRLQLMETPGRFTVIDDAFNSNIVGAKQAFQVLSQFPKQRIVVTPGMVELGRQEAEMNQAFGEAMAGCCDLAILVGKNRSGDIRAGLRKAGFPEENIRVVADLKEAAALLEQIAGPGDTILFENDLPDNY